MPNSILIVGSTSLLGQQLVKALEKNKFNFDLCNRMSNNGKVNEFTIESIASRGDRYKTVYLLAAHVPYGQMETFTPELVDANLKLPLQICRSFPSARIVYSSSVAVYGEPVSLPIDESHPFNQPNAYGLSKLAAETAIRSHPSFAILRYSSLYGNGMKPRSFLPAIIRQALTKQTISLAGDGSRLQNYLHISDATQILLKAGQHEANFILNAVGEKSRSNLYAAKLISKRIGGVQVMLRGTDTSPSYQYASTKLRDTLKKYTYASFEKTIGELVNDIRNQEIGPNNGNRR